jgi:hypothetical protein
MPGSSLSTGHDLGSALRKGEEYSTSQGFLLDTPLRVVLKDEMGTPSLPFWSKPSQAGPDSREVNHEP